MFTRVLDNGYQTDMLISDSPNYYRIQVKTIEAKSNDQYVDNRWRNSNVDYVIYFARNSSWSYVARAFTQKRRKVNTDGHIKFQQNRNDFLKAFHKV